MSCLSLLFSFLDFSGYLITGGSKSQYDTKTKAESTKPPAKMTQKDCIELLGESREEEETIEQIAL